MTLKNIHYNSYIILMNPWFVRLATDEREDNNNNLRPTIYL